MTTLERAIPEDVADPSIRETKVLPLEGESSSKAQELPTTESENIDAITREVPVAMEAEERDSEILRLQTEREAILAGFNEHRDDDSHDWRVYKGMNDTIDWYLGEKSRIDEARRSHERLSDADGQIYEVADQQIDLAASIRGGTRCSELLKELGKIDEKIKVRQEELKVN